jgi:hypothetical protein
VDIAEYRHHDSIVVARAPEDVYDLVADVTGMGRWSPVCTGATVDADDPSWFTGTNAIGTTTWSTRCRVVAAERGREFAFVNHGVDGRHELVRWGYTFAPVDGGTSVTETWEVLPGYEQGFAAEGPGGGTLADRLDLMRGLAVDGMRRTLERLKEAAESGGAAGAGASATSGDPASSGPASG